MATDDSYTTWLIPFSPHWRIGGVFLVAFASVLVGLLAFVAWRIARPSYFTGETFKQNIAVTETGEVVPLGPGEHEA